MESGLTAGAGACLVTVCGGPPAQAHAVSPFAEEAGKVAERECRHRQSNQSQRRRVESKRIGLNRRCRRMPYDRLRRAAGTGARRVPFAEGAGGGGAPVQANTA